MKKYSYKLKFYSEEHGYVHKHVDVDSDDELARVILDYADENNLRYVSKEFRRTN